jgi:hypothetical protein
VETLAEANARLAKNEANAVSTHQQTIIVGLTTTKSPTLNAVLVDQGKLYTDLTGKFPVRPSKGNWYVVVCYVFDCNYMKCVPMKSRSASEWVNAYDHIHQELTSKGFKPVNTSGKAGAQIPQLPLGDDSSPWGR